MVRDGIKTYLEGTDSIHVVAEAVDGKQAVDVALKEDIEVIILDINMPKLNGIEVAEILKKQKPELKILALTMLSESSHIRQMLKAGASGYLLKSCSQAELVEAIQALSIGENYFSKEVSLAIMQSITPEKTNKSKYSLDITLTRREKEILELIMQQLTNQEISDKLFISTRTVEAHKRNLIEKTNSKNLVGLALYALENQLID